MNNQPRQIIFPLNDMPQADAVKKIKKELESEKFENVWPGSTIDWKSKPIPVKLYAELPFWLMMPEGVFEVTVGEAKAKVEVVHSCEEIQSTPTDQTTHRSTVFIAKPSETPPEWVEKIVNSKNGFSVRIHRTTLIIEVEVLESVLKHVRDGTPLNKSQAYEYLKALAAGHLPVVNGLLSAYRRVSYDPFALEVTPATLPIWFYRVGEVFLRVSLMPYADQLHRPVWPTEAGPVPAELATVEAVNEYLKLEETPGETILLDSWNYFYSGRFNDAIRGMITAIEVLLEARYAKALKDSGMQDQQVEAEMTSTAQKFLTRMKNYQHVSKRTMPGPLLSHVPYINGVMLRDELNSTRMLRHKIVHEGLRISPFEFGAMLRIAETMTWLFDWLDDTPRNSENRFKFYNLKSYLKGNLILTVDYHAEGIRVLQSESGPPSLDEEDVKKFEDNMKNIMADELLWAHHARSLFGDYKDLSLFVKMAMTCVVQDNVKILQALYGINFGPLTDHDPPFPTPGVTAERFRVAIDGLNAVVFVLDLDGDVDLADLNGCLVRLLQLRVERKNERVRGICVVNHQRGLAPLMRQTHRRLDDAVTTLLTSCDMSLVFATDLARYLKGALDHKWPLTPVREGLKNGGFVPCNPPNSSYVGEVLKVFPKKSVIGLNADADPPLTKGERIVIRSNAGFEVLKAESLVQKGKESDTITKGESAVMVAFEVNKVLEGSFIYRLQPPVAEGSINCESPPSSTASVASSAIPPVPFLSSESLSG